MITILPGQVHIWIVQPEVIQEASLLTEYFELLTPEEKERQKRFHFEKDRKNYLCTRALVRSVLSEYGSVSPHEWKFERNTFDKPEIKRTSEEIPPLRFNLTHSNKLIACAVTLENNIGIDVENCCRSTDLLEIANRYFSRQEMQDLDSIHVHERGAKFFEYWTLKEAYIKACGKGLHIPLDAFSMDLTQSGKISISFTKERDDDPLHWQFHLYLCRDHYLSLAVETPAPLPAESVQIRDGIPLKKFTHTSCFPRRCS